MSISLAFEVSIMSMHFLKMALHKFIVHKSTPIANISVFEWSMIINSWCQKMVKCPMLILREAIIIFLVFREWCFFSSSQQPIIVICCMTDSITSTSICPNIHSIDYRIIIILRSQKPTCWLMCSTIRSILNMMALHSQPKSKCIPQKVVLWLSFLHTVHRIGPPC